MYIDLRKYSHHFELLYTDRMDITSTEESTDPDGATLNAYPDTPQQTDIPCKVSLPTKEKAVGEDSYERVSLNPVIFCSSEVAVKAGDRITARKCHADGTVYETFEGLLAETGKPSKFKTHQEFELRMEGDA